MTQASLPYKSMERQVDWNMSSLSFSGSALDRQMCFMFQKVLHACPLRHLKSAADELIMDPRYLNSSTCCIIVPSGSFSSWTSAGPWTWSCQYLAEGQHCLHAALARLGGLLLNHSLHPTEQCRRRNQDQAWWSAVFCAWPIQSAAVFVEEHNWVQWQTGMVLKCHLAVHPWWFGMVCCTRCWRGPCCWSCHIGIWLLVQFYLVFHMLSVFSTSSLWRLNQKPLKNLRMWLWEGSAYLLFLLLFSAAYVFAPSSAFRVWTRLDWV